MNEEERLNALHERAILDTPAEERFDRITRMAQRLFGVDEALVNLIDRDRQWTKSTSLGPQGSGNETPRADSFCTTTINYREGLVVEDALLDDRFRFNPLVTGDHPVRFYAGVPLAAPGGALVGTLCLVDHEPRRLSPSDLDLLRDLARWVEQELNIDSELDRAAAVQRALLPATGLPDSRWDIAGLCRPSRDVGGDFFDWYEHADTITVVIADVMGKGMPAAIVAATARAALRAGPPASPAATLSRAARTLAADLAATATFVTVFAAELAADGRIRYADAGHGHAAIARADGTVDGLERGTVPIGLGFGVDATDFEANLDAGDVLLIHSDGLLELAGGPRTTASAAASIAGAPTAADALDRLTASIGGAPPPDDITVLAIRRASAD